MAALPVAAAPQTAIAAERAFAADARRRGQWTAFRTWADADAVMFVPQPVKAQAWLRHRTDPAAALRWHPVQSIVACDGRAAVNFGFWTRPDSQAGYFVTAWRRRADGAWRWVVDAGDVLDHTYRWPRIEVSRGACQGRPDPLKPDQLAAGAQTGGGASRDGTLAWTWTYGPDGSRVFEAYLWDGRNMALALEKRVEPRAAP